ncbi:Protein cwh43 [Mycoemilia scoparia]|uniref:Protein cwh43 n=1 Tax=Mycoemilia scoparia TaxID=417184 RepID=A0A9W8A6D8_9FUNG|nr:Protein cwh43 [Mycoemilia scoparia]
MAILMYPERSVFQIFIALTCPARLLLISVWYYLCVSSPASVGKSNKTPLALFAIGFLRTVTCGGWVYVTSTDDHDIHDIMMISYMIFTLPYMILMIKTGSSRTLTNYTAPAEARLANKRRKIVCALFFGSIPPMVYFFISHKVHKVPGAYTTYAFFEWALILFDVLFDSLAMTEFKFIDIGLSHSKQGLVRD